MVILIGYFGIKSDMTLDQKFPLILTWLTEHFAKQIELKQIARHFRVDYHHLSRAFKNKTGRKFTIYLQHVRLNEIVPLISSSLTSKELYAKSGFQSDSQFNRAFKKHFGVNLSTFRAQK
jgi:AraC-like DNA-binding protein